MISAPRIRSKWILGMTQNKLRFVTTFYPGAYLLFSLKTEISKVEVNFHFKNLLQRFFKVYSQQNYRPSHSFKASLRSNSLEFRLISVNRGFENSLSRVSNHDFQTFFSMILNKSLERLFLTNGNQCSRKSKVLL